MNNVLGTQGYERDVDRFVNVSQSLSFFEVCAEVIPFLPESPCRVLDIGSGAGQNAAALSQLGHTVVAVEPMEAFRAAARSRYGDLTIAWIDDALPHLRKLDNEPAFDFVLVDAVWHHLDTDERDMALTRIFRLMKPGAHLACSLRNGPSGLGSRVFPTEAESTVMQARKLGLECALRKDNQASFLPGKEDVLWSRLVFLKPVESGSVGKK